MTFGKRLGRESRKKEDSREQKTTNFRSQSAMEGGNKTRGVDKFGGFDGAPPLFFNTFSSGWEEFSPRNLPGLGAIHEARSSSWKRIFESSTLGRRPFIVSRISAGETFPRLKLGRSFACGIASLYICTGVYKEGGGRINRSDLDGNRGMSEKKVSSFHLWGKEGRKKRSGGI